MVRNVSLMSLALLAGIATSASAQVKLEYKFAEGTTSSKKTNTKIHQIMVIAGMNVETEFEQVIVTSSSAGKRNADGTLPLTEKIESLHADLGLPGGINFTFDSANPDAKVDNPGLAFLNDIFKAVSGMSYTVVLEKTNKVKFVEGTEKLEAKLDGLAPMAADALRGRFRAERIKKDFEQAHSKLPTVLAREGEPWEVTEVQDIGNDQTLTFRKQYEYRGTVKQEGRTLDKITVRAKTVAYAMDPDTKSPLKATKSELKIDASDGTILFDREAGQVVETQETTRIKGDITFTTNGQEVPSTLDLTLETKSADEKSAK